MPQRPGRVTVVSGDCPETARVTARLLGPEGPPVRVTLVRLDGAVAGDSEVDTSALKNLENHAARPEIRQK